jgi:tetratricopeptide (TPR) repeat protein
MTVRGTKSIEIFYSYADADEALCSQLEKHLATLKQQGLIMEWRKHKIMAGSTGADEIDAHLKSAQIILLLVSPDFIASPYCYGVEMQEALRRHESGDSRVIPVILRPVDWAGTPFEKLSPLPKNAKPVTKWSPRYDGFLSIATGIREVVEQLKQTFASSIVSEKTPQSEAGGNPLNPQSSPASVSQNTASLEIEGMASSYLHIRSIPPLTDYRTIQQREHLVKDLYGKLTQSNITAIALTGISGVGKSTLAALLYHYAEKQRLLQSSPFQFPALWLTIDPAVTFVDLVGNIFEALGVPLPNLSNLATSNQALVLFNALNRVDKARLVVLDQFENLLDWETGHAQADRPGVGEWLDIINSQPCSCRLLLTSRPRPIGTREYPLTYMQEYSVGGLEADEGVDLLRSQGVVGTEAELRKAVEECAGHAFALTLLVSLARDYNISLSTLFKDATLWTGDIATNLLDRIYTQQLSEMQRQLLLAFSAYREPVPLDAIVATVPGVKRMHITRALKALRTQRLLEAVGENRYRLHAIIAGYARHYLDDGGEMLRTVHARSAQYYLQRAAITSPSWKQRRSINDVHDLIEAIWQHCQAEQWQEAYARVQEEGFVEDLKHWGGNAILLEVYQLLLPLEKWQPNTLQKVQIYNDLGWIYNDLGRKQQALEYYKRAMEISEEAAIQNGRGRLLSNIGSVYDGWGERIQAVEYYKQALPIYQESGDHKGEAWVLNSLGRAYIDFGQFEQAGAYLDRAFLLRKEAGDRGGMGRTLNNLGVLSIRIGKKEEALNFLKEALCLLRDAGDLNGQSRALHRLGQLYNTFGQQEEALKYYEQALDIRVTIGDRRGEGRVLGNIGLVYSELGQYKRAWEYYKRALPICREIEDYEMEGRVLDRLGALYLTKQDYDVATAFFILARNVFDKIKNLEIGRVEDHLELVRRDIGNDSFTELLERTKSQAHQIVDQAWTSDW